MVASTEPGNVVQAFTIGNTRIKICDDYCRDKSHEDVEIILQRIAQRALLEFSAAAENAEN